MATRNRAVQMTFAQLTFAPLTLAAVAMFAWAALMTLASAQTGKELVDPNTVAASELQGLPNMTPALVADMVAQRPFKSVIDLNKFLIGHKLTQDQAREVYRRAFVKINLNTGTRDEFMLIPGVGARMSAEFAEYRPWKTWAQFDKEIGKYVGQQETDRFKLYVFIPPA
jgi:DNA uptake protein ComE-like DNA-binding protein